MSGHRELPAALLVVASIAAGSPARAEQPARVVVIGASEQEPIVARVEQELRALGFVVTFATTTDADSASIARAASASAVLRVATQPLEIRIWIAARKRDGASSAPEAELPRDFKIDAPGDKSDPAVVALGAVELLHGALLPIDTRPREPMPSSAPPLVVARPADVTPRRDDERGPFAFQLGGGASIAPGGVAAAPIVFAGGAWQPRRALELALFALLPTSPASVLTTEGTIRVRVGGAGAGIGAAFIDRRFDLHASLGAGLLVTAVDGVPRAGAGSAASSASSASFYPYARVAAAVRLVPWLSARADVLAGLLTPEPIVESLDRPVARVGQPELALVASLEARP